MVSDLRFISRRPGTLFFQLREEFLGDVFFEGVKSIELNSVWDIDFGFFVGCGRINIFRTGRSSELINFVQWD